MPALRALLAQGAALVLVLLLSLGITRLPGVELSVAHGVLLQAVLAAAFSRLFGLARWWIWIQLLFPPAAALVHALRLPPWLFLAGFVALVALYWSSFRTQVPYYPSRQRTWEEVTRLLEQEMPGRALSFIDIGSGFGGLVMHVARGRTAGRSTGIELAPLPWLASVLRARVSGSAATFLRGDYGTLDLGCYDVVFAYLSPAAMPALWEKASREMGPGSLLLSHEFPIPGKPAHITLQAPDTRAPLYCWRL